MKTRMPLRPPGSREASFYVFTVRRFARRARAFAGRCPWLAFLIFRLVFDTLDSFSIVRARRKLKIPNFGLHQN
jgi:hypothetical protein